ncbi:MAG: nitrate reductase molybdenum cofactor assembly chaperone [Pseudomonadota bacterium]
MKESQLLQTYRCFSNLLDYPTQNLVEQTRTCINLLKRDYPQAAEKMASFLKFAESTPLGSLEEVYTGTFDINPACHIFAGHILFGESFKRGAFMARLEEEYQKQGFDAKKELADHIPVLLNFLCTLEPDDSLANDLIYECLIPVFQKMNDNFKDDSPNPYVPVLRSALIVLQN